VSTADDDKFMFGEGEKLTLMMPDGLDEQYISSDVLLTNEFEMAVVAPGELDPDQEEPAFLVTFKGRSNNTRGLTARTLVFTPEMAHALFKSLNKKWRELPVEFR
jgi:hypothetical protein